MRFTVSLRVHPAGAADLARPDWLHEVKFDGYRAQIHAAGANVEIFSKNGAAAPRTHPSCHERVA